MDDEDPLVGLKPGESLLLSAYPQSATFEIPVFFEPLSAEAIARANEGAWLVGIVLDENAPVGRAWIARIRELGHMLPGNTRHFGTSPYYYAFRHWRTLPRYDVSNAHHVERERALQYLVRARPAGPGLTSANCAGDAAVVAGGANPEPQPGPHQAGIFCAWSSPAVGAVCRTGCTCPCNQHPWPPRLSRLYRSDHR